MQQTTSYQILGIRHALQKTVNTWQHIFIAFTKMNNWVRQKGLYKIIFEFRTNKLALYPLIPWSIPPSAAKSLSAIHGTERRNLFPQFMGGTH